MSQYRYVHEQYVRYTNVGSETWRTWVHRSRHTLSFGSLVVEFGILVYDKWTSLSSTKVHERFRGTTVLYPVVEMSRGRRESTHVSPKSVELYGSVLRPYVPVPLSRREDVSSFVERVFGPWDGKWEVHYPGVPGRVDVLQPLLPRTKRPKTSTSVRDLFLYPYRLPIGKDSTMSVYCPENFPLLKNSYRLVWSYELIFTIDLKDLTI